MAAALLTAIFASITGIVAAIYLAYRRPRSAVLAQHISIGIFSTMITLLAHSMMMFYFLGKDEGRQRSGGRRRALEGVRARIAVVRKPVFSIATLAMLATMVTALVGASVDTGVVPSWVHGVLAYSCLAGQSRARFAWRSSALTESGARRRRSQSAAAGKWGADPVIVLKDVEKQYGGCDRCAFAICASLPAARRCSSGFDRPAAEIFVNLVTGATLPDKGEVISLGRPTAGIVNSDEWLTFVERFGIVSDRIVLLDAMTVAQNLAISFDLHLDPVPPDVLARVTVACRRSRASTAATFDDARGRRVAAASCADLSRPRARARSRRCSSSSIRPPACRRRRRIEYAAIVKRGRRARALTTLGLLMDERFAKATGGRLLFWQPATGEVRARFAASGAVLRRSATRARYF